MKETPISKDGLAQKLRPLQNMTVANGYTESEALVSLQPMVIVASA